MGAPTTSPASKRSNALAQGAPALLLVAAGAALCVALYLVFQVAPNDAQQGIAQKIFYFHLPGAIFGYVGFTVCCIASIVYLVKPSPTVDVVAQSGASVGVVFCAMVLVSGPLWAKKIWGTYWTGEPRLVLTLALFVIFVAYVLVRSYGGRTRTVRRIGAVLAIFGFADIPLVRYAVQKWGGNHPQVVTGSGGGIAESMQPALIASFVAMGLLFAALLWMRIRLGWAEERVEALHLEIGDRELLVEG